MRFIKVFVFLALLGSPVGAQPLTVLGEEPFDLSPLAQGGTVQLGVINRWYKPLDITVKLENKDRVLVAEILKGSIQKRGSQNYFPLAFPEQKSADSIPSSGYVVVEAREKSGDSPLLTIVKRFENSPPFRLHWVVLLAPILAGLAVWQANKQSRAYLQNNEDVIRGWVAGTPKVSFTESFGSLSTVFLAVSNSAIIPVVSEVAQPSATPLQIMGVIFALPVILAPVILRAKLHSLAPGEEFYKPSEADDAVTTDIDEKVSDGWFIFSSFIALTGTLLQIYVLYEWLKLIDLSFLPTLPFNFAGQPEILGAMAAIGWNALIPAVIALLIVQLGFATTKNALRNLRLCQGDNPPLSGAQLLDLLSTSQLALMPDTVSPASSGSSASSPRLVLSPQRRRRKLHNTLY